MAVKFKTVITKAGAIKLAAATTPNGKKVNLTVMAVGDGGGTLPTPDPNQTKLVREVWRNTLNKISQDNKNKNYVVAELVIPPETGGFWMREMGLYDDTGTLIAVGNMAESYKPELAEGSGRAQAVRMVIMVSDIESVELAIDTTLVMATQDYVDDKLAEHEQSRRHPDATLTAKGFTQLSNATDSSSEVLAATPKAVKAAYDLAKVKYTAQDATTSQKGIIQLSSATDSTSEVLAATPKAVKIANDNANTRLPLTGGWLTGGFGIKTAIGSVSFGVGNSDVYIANGASNKFLQLKHTGELKYDDKAVYHEGYKPTAEDVEALPVKGTAEAAKKLATARKIAGVTFDGTSDITLKTSNLDDAGTAATKDVTTSNSDTTGGRVLKVGDFGLGAFSAVFISDANNVNYNGFFSMSAEGIHGPVANTVNEFIHVQYNQNTGRQVGWRAGRPDEPIRHRTKVNAEWQDWIKIYDSNNPPTADEVDAVSASKGGTFQKEVAFSGGIKLRNSTGIYQGEDAAGFSSNNLMLNSWNGIGFYCTLTGSEGVTVFVDTRGGNLEAKGQIKPGDFTNFDNRFYTKTLANSTFQKVNTASKGSRGWFKDSSTGMIFQWGIESVSGATTRIFSFPVSFPTGCASLTVSNNIERTAGENSMTGFIKSASQYSLSNTAATDRQLCWFAVGY